MEKKKPLASSLFKSLAYYLTFGPKKEGFKITSDGFIKLSGILETPPFKSAGVTEKDLEDSIKSDKKSCYELQNLPDQHNQASLFIRLKQSQSIVSNTIEKIGKKVENSSEIPMCIYGTFKDVWDWLKKEGIQALPSKCFEFVKNSEDLKANNEKDETRYDAFIEIDVEKAMADGVEFFQTQNGVIYSKGLNGEIPAKYFKGASLIVKGKLIKVSLVEREKKPEKAEESKEDQTKEENEAGKIPFIDPNPNLKGTHFKYLCILDFEAQCKDGEKLKVQEIIEFPVVVVDVEQKKVTDIFHYYVKPTEYPQLFPFCTELTGITQDKVDNGLLLPDVLEKLHTFLEEKGILNSSFCFVTCGDWDLNICLRCETRAKKIPVRGYLKRWINIKKVYPMPADQGNRMYGMATLLKLSNLTLDGKHHSGIDDSKNIAKIVLYLLEKQMKYTVSMVSYVNY